MVLSLIIGAIVAGGTYAYTQRRRKTTGESVMLAAATGVGTALVAGVLLPVVGTALLVAAPVAVGYYLVKKSDRKALPPG